MQCSTGIPRVDFTAALSVGGLTAWLYRLKEDMPLKRQHRKRICSSCEFLPMPSSSHRAWPRCNVTLYDKLRPARRNHYKLAKRINGLHLDRLIWSYSRPRPKKKIGNLDYLEVLHFALIASGINSHSTAYQSKIWQYALLTYCVLSDCIFMLS